jgi:glycosyltransferase involved in cell wall biosynthesis
MATLNVTEKAMDAASADRPLVSVVIPTYNCANFIVDAIDSVLAQNYAALEIIVVDDGSTDDTESVLEKYADKIVFIRQPNAGSAVARNQGMRRASGEYIAFLDADDIWLPGKLTIQVDYLQKHADVDMCCAKWILLNAEPDGRFRPKTTPIVEAPVPDPQISGWIYHKLLLDCEVWTGTVVMRRDLAKRVGDFLPELRRGQDYDYWLRASRVARIAILDAPMALYRIDPSRAAEKLPETNWELMVISKALNQFGTTGPDGAELSAVRLSTRLWSLNFNFGHSQFHGRRFDLARAAFWQALRQRPWHFKTFAYWVMSLVNR